MDKLTASLFILGFWLILPLGMALFGIGGYDKIEVSAPTEPPKNIVIGFFQWSSSILELLGMYFNLLLFNIVGVPLVIRYFLNFMQLTSVVLILFIMRGSST